MSALQAHRLGRTLGILATGLYFLTPYIVVTILVAAAAVWLLLKGETER